ncbi:helix-turn-helix domain-containing protein [Sphingomonas phyllosphaerae]|uniref:helix-turn-helix domain-containing protein n=1 Tax=Sphingomonas phyllosphaerae TaxID=257003 RepID=UPI0024138410|nr:helix-turn-helix domain-containing protein [Sphingomonas phyllosphaerae]
MASWSFSLDEIEAGERQSAWIDVLSRLRLPVADPGSMRAAAGAVTVATGPLGTEFALMSASAQTFSGRSVDLRSSAWIVAIIAGEGVLAGAGGETPVARGSLIVGAPEIDTTLRMDSDFRLLFVRFPQVAVSSRLVTPVERTVRAVWPNAGFNALFFGFLDTLAEQIGALGEDHLLATEQSTIELLITLVASSGGMAARGGAAGARASHLRRLCQRIEARLSDPELSPIGIAAEDGITPRYLQKLFTAAGLRFSSYVRERRLERCYADLVSPIHAQLSISEICYRWGFGDAPHFSRAFRARYGISPSQHRDEIAEAELSSDVGPCSGSSWRDAPCVRRRV